MAKEIYDSVIETGSRVEKGLPNIFFFKFRIFSAKLLTVEVDGRQFHNTTNR